MKNLFNPNGYANRGIANKVRQRLARIKLAAVSTLLFAALAIVYPFVGQAQGTPLKVTNVSTHAASGATTVSIAADGSLGRAQTWHDSEGYHVVLPNTVAVDSTMKARGFKVRRVGTSLEFVLQTKPGARVHVQSSDNKLNLVIDGKLNGKSVDPESTSASISPESQYSNSVPQPLTSSTFDDSASRSRPTGAETAQNSTNWNPQMGPQAAVPDRTSAQKAAPLVPASEVEIQPEDDGLLASVFSGSSVLVVMALGLFGLLVSYKLRSRQGFDEVKDSGLAAAEEEGEPTGRDAGTSLIRGSHSAQANGSSGLARKSAGRQQVAGPTSLFGAYRIDQEVGKLVFGQAHRLDVLSSRAVDDRRAIETSLIKSVNSPDLDENGRRKAREALEEYGFVARQCAALLLAPDAFERTSAARTLGEIKSPAALPFLLEGLYDSESIVRNQAVVSIGELKLPGAIGALLDIARTHPDVPSALLSRTLSACSVEGLDFFDAVMPEPSLLGSGQNSRIVEQITHLQPTSSVEDLPETLDDERLAQALTLVASNDVQERAEGLKVLVQFPVQSSVAAMALVARADSEPNLRSVAISSLGTINHESVFASILIGMADESREVRAAAARSLNRLCFDRAEAYVRVIETSDEATIINVAKACIQAGIVSQNLDRLATSDHRQAYETFALICLLAKAKMNQPVLNAIADHPNGNVRVTAVHLLACTGQPEASDQLRDLAVKAELREDVKTALFEAIYKLDEAKRKEDEKVEPVPGNSEPQFEVVARETPETDFKPHFDVAPTLEPVSESTNENAKLKLEFDPTVEKEALLSLDDVER